MNVVDSSGWIEYFADAENADFFAGPIEEFVAMDYNKYIEIDPEIRFGIFYHS
jgi:hypothetical protein